MISCAQAGLIGQPQGWQKYQGLRAFSVYNTTPPAGSVSVITGSDAVFGDVVGYVTTSTPSSYVVTLDNSEVPTIVAGGDSSRQLFDVDLYRFVLRKWTGNVTEAINDQAPATDFAFGSYHLTKDVAIISVDFGSHFTDFEADTITYSTTGTLPPGTTVNATTGVWSGTPTAIGTDTFYVVGTDPYGSSDSTQVDWRVALASLVGKKTHNSMSLGLSLGI